MKRISGMLMPLVLLLLVSITMTANSQGLFKEAYSHSFTIIETKFYVEEELVNLQPLVNENMTAFAVDSEQTFSCFYYNNNSGFLYGSNIDNNTIVFGEFLHFAEFT